MKLRNENLIEVWIIITALATICIGFMAFDIYYRNQIKILKAERDARQEYIESIAIPRRWNMQSINERLEIRAKELI